MPQEEDSSNEEEEEEDKEIYEKLSVTPVVKRDTSVATAPATCGINQMISVTGLHALVKRGKQWLMTEAFTKTNNQ